MGKFIRCVFLTLFVMYKVCLIEAVRIPGLGWSIDVTKFSEVEDSNKIVCPFSDNREIRLRINNSSYTKGNQEYGYIIGKKGMSEVEIMNMVMVKDCHTNDWFCVNPHGEYDKGCTENFKNFQNIISYCNEWVCKNINFEPDLKVSEIYAIGMFLYKYKTCKKEIVKSIAGVPENHTEVGLCVNSGCFSGSEMLDYANVSGSVNITVFKTMMVNLNDDQSLMILLIFVVLFIACIKIS